MSNRSHLSLLLLVSTLAACSSDPKKARQKYLDSGASYAKKGQYSAAIVQYQKALKINPYNAEAHNNLGVALAGRGQIDDAIAHYQKALELNPEYAEVHNNFGSIQAGRGHIDDAIAHFQKALEINPDYADAHKNLELARRSKK